MDDRIRIPNHPAYNGEHGNISIEAWIKVDALGATKIMEHIVSTYASGSVSGFAFSLSCNGTLSLTINGSGDRAGSAVNLRDGICHHVAVVREDTVVSY